MGILLCSVREVKHAHCAKVVRCSSLLDSVVILLLLPLGGPAVDAQGNFVLRKAITYGKGGDVDLRLDLASPTTGNGPFPALVCIGSGGWVEMSRNDYYPEIMQAASRGFVAVTVDYGVTSAKENGKTKYRFPALVYDVKCAVRWLRANAREYGIDSGHIGAIGFAAGGYLALMPSDRAGRWA